MTPTLFLDGDKKFFTEVKSSLDGEKYSFMDLAIDLIFPRMDDGSLPLSSKFLNALLHSSSYLTFIILKFGRDFTKMVLPIFLNFYPVRQVNLIHLFVQFS